MLVWIIVVVGILFVLKMLQTRVLTDENHGECHFYQRVVSPFLVWKGRLAFFFLNNFVLYWGEWKATWVIKCNPFGACFILGFVRAAVSVGYFVLRGFVWFSHSELYSFGGLELLCELSQCLLTVNIHSFAFPMPLWFLLVTKLLLIVNEMKRMYTAFIFRCKSCSTTIFIVTFDVL